MAFWINEQVTSAYCPQVKRKNEALKGRDTALKVKREGGWFCSRYALLHLALGVLKLCKVQSSHKTISASWSETCYNQCQEAQIIGPQTGYG